MADVVATRTVVGATPSTLPRLESMVRRLDALLTEVKHLRDELRESESLGCSPSDVIAVVAQALGSTPAEVTGGRRYAGAVRARHAAALALQLGGLSHRAIARTLGMKDHSSAADAVARGRHRLVDEPAFAAAVAAGERAWRGGEAADV